MWLPSSAADGAGRPIPRDERNGPSVTPLANDACGMQIRSGNENSDINGGVNAIDLVSRNSSLNLLQHLTCLRGQCASHLQPMRMQSIDQLRLYPQQFILRGRNHQYVIHIVIKSSIRKTACELQTRLGPHTIGICLANCDNPGEEHSIDIAVRPQQC
ncbi:hypothetical protein DUI87_29883 [Hirundo rustica rustica]|uniref:Uncharacterized protein n=1 Tax=Hirundo rustica rustica TaxID=333673 RepID=A0A3M0JG25_HIRRU|nr:hypothetical protein DUI87_29883 [Hirundo rustica rustica]